MRFLFRILGAIVLLISTLVFAACVAGIVGVWKYQDVATQKMEQIATRLDGGLERAAAATKDILDALKKARAAVEQANKESMIQGAPAGSQSFTTAIFKRFVTEEAGQQINALGGKLSLFSDASVAASSLLQSFQELPLGETGRVNPENLKRVSVQATQLSASLQKLQSAVGEVESPATQKEAAAAAGEIVRVLQECDESVSGWQSDLDAARADAKQLKQRILHWLLIGSIAATAVLGWIALSQLSLFAHAWQWCRGA